MKAEQRVQARLMRSTNGMSVKEIARKLDVAQSSVSRWVKDVRLSDSQTDALRLRCRSSPEVLEACRETWRKRRFRQQEIGREKYRNGDKLFAFCCALYWGEGCKVRNVVSLCNTDVLMLKLFVSFLTTNFDIEPRDITMSVQCHLNNGLTLNDVHNFWLKELGLSAASLRSATIKTKSYPTTKRQKYPYGICRVVVCKVEVVQQIFGAIKEATGDGSDRWLD